MANKRVCPHTVTIYNYLGEDASGNAQYSPTVLSFVHLHLSRGVSANGTPSDSTRFHFFDDVSTASKTFVPYDEWQKLPIEKKKQSWTLNAHGLDFLYAGACQNEALPQGENLFRITRTVRFEMGRKCLWHWKVEAE